MARANGGTSRRVVAAVCTAVAPWTAPTAFGNWRRETRLSIPCHCAPDIPLNVSFCMPAPVAAT